MCGGALFSLGAGTGLRGLTAACGGALLSLEAGTGLRGLTAACGGALLSLEADTGLGGEQLHVEELCSACRLRAD